MDVVRVILEPICARPWLVGVRSCVYSTCENVSGLPLQFGFIPTQAVQAVTPPRPLSVSRPPGAWTHWLGVLAFAIGGAILFDLYQGGDEIRRADTLCRWNR